MLSSIIKNKFGSTLFRLLFKIEPILQLQPRYHFRLNNFLFRECCRKLSAYYSSPFFVKVGANDGLTGDPCSDILLNDRKWRGILIEPVPYNFERLKENFKDHSRFLFEQIAIGKESGQAKFFYVDKIAKEKVTNLPDWYDQIGSFDRNHILKHLNGVLEPYIIECEIEVNSLSETLKRNEIQEIHLLHIDTEGFDLEILKSIDLSQIQPVIIYIEHQHLDNESKQEMLSILSSDSYLIKDCGADFFAYKQELLEYVEKQ
ncbi:MAG: FkbM family methyltransferase [Proteobacteria bacterium]|nr:FkbM family methyltransferase [Pseudomonadota bacterium]